MDASLSQIPKARNWGYSFGKFYAIGSIVLCILYVVVLGLSIPTFSRIEWLRDILGALLSILFFVIWTPVSVVALVVFERKRISTKAPLLLIVFSACTFQCVLFQHTSIPSFSNVCMAAPMIFSLVLYLWFYPRENWLLYNELSKGNQCKSDNVIEPVILKSFVTFRKRSIATLIDALVLGMIGAILFTGLGLTVAVQAGLAHHRTTVATLSKLLTDGYLPMVLGTGFQTSAFGGIIGSTLIPNAIPFILGFGLPEHYSSSAHPGAAFGWAYNYFSACIAWLYYACMESSPLQGTIGKKIVGIIVTDVKEERISFWKASLRYFSKIASIASLFMGFLFGLFSLKKQTLHDYLAGCVVVNKREQHFLPDKPIITGLARITSARISAPTVRMADAASSFKLRQVISKQVCLICNQEFELADDIKMCPSDGSMLSPVFDDPFIGKIIDEKYEIVERIASGGTSKIYKARHLTLDRYVALKVLQGGQEITEAQLGRFQKEAQVAIGLVHPNIVRVYDYGTHPQPYIVMEYVAGRTLAALIKEEGAPLAKRALPFFIQICEAMSMAHAAGLVHRDIKPSNVIIENGSEAAKIFDFGLVKDFVDDAQYTRTGETVGSPAYMSPEQCKGLFLDARSDIYSLGCVMYEVLTGKSPFSGDNTVECMFKHLETPAPPLRKARRDLRFPAGLEKVISNCLAKKAEERYQSMEDLKNDLDAVTKHRPRNVRTFKTRTKLKVGLFGIVLSLTVGVLALAIVFGHKPPPIFPNPNKLAVGAQAKKKGIVSIALHPPIVLNGKTKEQIFSIRQAQLDSHNDLLAAKYAPFDPIFAHVDYRSPWLSVKGLVFTKQDGLSITDGESWESVWITNPLLLVAPDFMEVQDWHRRLIGNPDKIKNFPYRCLPRNLVWNPVNRLMEVTYDMDEYCERVMEVNDFKEPLDLMNGMNVSLDTMNARDLGYNFMKLEVEGDDKGKQASAGPTQLAISLIANNFHGCKNNHAHPPDGRMGYWFPSVRIRPPCTERVMLYKNEPRSSHQTPDVTCLIHFNYHRDGHENALNFLEQRKQEVIRAEGADSTSLLSIYRRLGDAYVKEEKSPEAQDSYGHALKIASEGAVCELMNVLDEFSSSLSDEIETADAQIDKLAQHQNWLPYARSIAKGVCFYNLDNPDQAILHFDNAISQGPNCASLYAGRGAALKWMGRYKEAISDYSEALRLDKDWTTLKDSIKECELDRENSTKSGSGLIAALANITRPTRVPYLIAALYEESGLDKFEKGRYAKAAAYFKNSMELYGRSSIQRTYMAIMGSLSYSFAHNDASSQELLHLAETKTESGVWPHPVISYFQRRITREQLLNLAGKDNDKLTEAWTYIGLDLMLANHISEAKGYFKQVVDKGNKEFIEYRLANTKLEKLR